MDTQEKTKFCKHCGAKIPEDAVLCTACGRQVEELKGSAPAAQQAAPQIVINNANANTNTNTNANMNVNGAVPGMKLCNKWVSLLLCIFLGVFGAHKFYENKIGMGIVYLFTGGLFCVGVVVDFISILGKPNPYYVRY